MLNVGDKRLLLAGNDVFIITKIKHDICYYRYKNKLLNKEFQATIENILNSSRPLTEPEMFYYFGVMP